MPGYAVVCCAGTAPLMSQIYVREEASSTQQAILYDTESPAVVSSAWFITKQFILFILIFLVCMLEDSYLRFVSENAWNSDYLTFCVQAATSIL